MAALFCLSLAAPQSRADHAGDPLYIGSGVTGFCPTGSQGAGTFPPSVGGSCWVYDESKASTPPTPSLAGPYDFTQVNELTEFGKLSVYKNGNQHQPLKDPILLIAVVPNFNLFDFSTAPFPVPETTALDVGTVINGGATLFAGYGPMGTFGPPAAAGTDVPVLFGSAAYGLPGFAGSFDATSTGSVYDFLGLQHVNDSASFTNMQKADWNIPQQLLGAPPSGVPYRLRHLCIQPLRG